MANTIKEIIEELTNPLVHIQTGFYLPDHKIDEVVDEISRLLEEAKPKYQAFTRDMVSRGEVKDKLDEYSANIERILK